MTLEPITLVLIDAFTADQMNAIADARGWRLTADVPRGHAEPAARQWETPDGTLVAYVEDHVGDVRMVQIAGPGRDLLAAELRRVLPYVDVSALLDEAETAEAPVTCVRALCRLVVCRPPVADRRWLGVWAKMLAHPHRAVRRAALRTAHACPWPELRPILESRLREETDLRDQLRALLQRA